jgi:hypothetical protein
MEFEQNEKVQSRMDDVYKCLWERDCTNARLKLMRPRFGVSRADEIDIIHGCSYTIPYKLDLNEIIQSANDLNMTELPDVSEVQNWVSTGGGVEVVSTGIQGDITYTLNLPAFVEKLDLGLKYIKGSFLYKSRRIIGEPISIFDVVARIGDSRVTLNINIPTGVYIPKVVTTLLKRETFSKDYFFSGLEFGQAENVNRIYSKVKLLASVPQLAWYSLSISDNVGVCLFYSYF